MKSINKLALIIQLFVFSNFIYAQDSLIISQNNKLSLNPKFFGVQIDFNTLLLIYEYGGHLDYDIFSDPNDFYNIGIRLGLEHYYTSSFGGETFGSPFTNYNLVLRNSLRGKILWFDMVGGLTYYKTSASDYYPDEILLRAGFELSYRFMNNFFGILIKGSTSFKERTGFIGIGLSIGYYKSNS